MRNVSHEVSANILQLRQTSDVMEHGYDSTPQERFIQWNGHHLKDSGRRKRHFNRSRHFFSFGQDLVKNPLQLGASDDFEYFPANVLLRIHP